MYGRAKRLNLIKNIVVIIASLVGIFFIGKMVVSFLTVDDDNIEFSYMKKYLNGKGFICESLKTSGGTCKNRTDGVYEMFVRYDKGFDYVYNNDSYVIELYHVDGEEKFTFSTGDTAFSGYRNLRYTCTYKDTIINELDKCILENGDEELDNEAYIGFINRTMYEVRKIIVSSKYNVDDLIERYEWNK